MGFTTDQAFLGEMLFHSSGRCGWRPISVSNNRSAVEWFSTIGFLESLFQSLIRSDEKIDFDFSSLLPLNVSFSDMLFHKEQINNACSRQLSTIGFPFEVNGTKIEVGSTMVEKGVFLGHAEHTMATVIFVLRAYFPIYAQISKTSYSLVITLLSCLSLVPVFQYRTIFSIGEKCPIARDNAPKPSRKDSSRRDRRTKEANAMSRSGRNIDNVAQEKTVTPPKPSIEVCSRAKIDQNSDPSESKLPIAKEKSRRRRNRKAAGDSVNSASSSTLSSAASANQDYPKSSFPIAKKSVHEKKLIPQIADQPSKKCKTPEFVSKRKSNIPNARLVTKDNKPASPCPSGGRKILRTSPTVCVYPPRTSMYNRAPGSNLHRKTSTKEKNGKVNVYDIWADHFAMAHLMGISEDGSARTKTGHYDNDFESFFVMSPEMFLAD